MIYLDENGVTVKAKKGAVVGNKYELNGKFYTVVDRDLLYNLQRSNMDLSLVVTCLLYTSPSPRDRQKSRMPSSA